MPRDVVLHGALLEGTGTQMDKPLFRLARSSVGEMRRSLHPRWSTACMADGAPNRTDGSQGCRRRDTDLLSTFDLKLSAVGLTAADGDPVTP